MPRVRAVVQHLRRHRVPEDMARAGLSIVPFPGSKCLPSPSACCVSSRCRISSRTDDRCRCWRVILWPHVFQIPQPRQRHGPPERPDPCGLLPCQTFTTPRRVSIPQHQVRQLHPPDPGTPEHLRMTWLRRPTGVLISRLCSTCPRLVLAEHLRRKPLFGFCSSSRIGGVVPGSHAVSAASGKRFLSRLSGPPDR